jgi:hypothetical protein
VRPLRDLFQVRLKKRDGELPLWETGHKPFVAVTVRRLRDRFTIARSFRHCDGHGRASWTHCRRLRIMKLSCAFCPRCFSSAVHRCNPYFACGCSTKVGSITLVRTVLHLEAAAAGDEFGYSQTRLFSGAFASSRVEIDALGGTRPGIVQELLKRNLYEILGERNSVLRGSASTSFGQKTAPLLITMANTSARDALNAAIATVQEHTPGFVFRELGDAQAHQGVGRLAWGMVWKVSRQR